MEASPTRRKVASASRKLQAERTKKPPKTTGPRGAADSVHFRERLDGAARFLVRRAAGDRSASVFLSRHPCQLRHSVARRDALAWSACAPEAGPAHKSLLVDRLAAPLRCGQAWREDRPMVFRGQG